MRRHGGARAGGFPGAARILAELDGGPARRRVGLVPEGRAPLREGVVLFADPESGGGIGRISSGGFGPSVDGPVSMAILPLAHCAIGSRVYAELRGKRVAAKVTPLPFRPAGFKR